MKSTITTAKLSQLAKSPLNVREKTPDAKIIDQLAASILARGLIQPLAVHRGAGLAKGKLGVLAGSRRWHAIQKLKKDGADFDFDAIPVSLIEGSEAELTEISLHENYVREAMRPPEIYAAFRLIRERDPAITDADLARHFNLPASRVARIMRLAYLHPEVFAAYDAGRINDEQAYAYAATEDQALQLQVFEHLSQLPANQHFPRHIRDAMKVGLDEHRALLNLVGLDAYVAAGGVFTVDLFAQEPNTGIVEHEDILRRLANDKIEEAKRAYTSRLIRGKTVSITGSPEHLKENLQFSWADAAPTITQHGYTQQDHSLRVTEELGKFEDDAQEARSKEIEQRLRQILYGSDGYKAERPRLTAEQRALNRQRAVILPKKGAVIGVPKVEPDGDVTVTLWFASRTEAQLETPKGAGATKSPAERQRANWGLTKDAMQAMLMYRREMIRAQLVLTAESGAGLEFLVYSQARSILRPNGETYDKRPTFSGHPQGIETPADQESSGGRAPALVRKLFDTLTIDPEWRETMQRLAAEPWVTAPDPIDGWVEFSNAGEETLRLAAAIVAGHTLFATTSYYGEGRAPRMIEELACTLEGEDGSARWYDLATFDKAFFDLIAHKQRLRLLDQWGLGDRAKTLKKGDSAAFCARVIRAARAATPEDELDAQKLGLGDEDRGDIATWIPEWLDTHTVAPLPASDDDGEGLEDEDGDDADLDEAAE
jgi:ParB family transcriptional regulator, chromosome partitioning protein